MTESTISYEIIILLLQLTQINLQDHVIIKVSIVGGVLSGSIQGGTILIIKGISFNPDFTKNSVQVNPYPCYMLADSSFNRNHIILSINPSHRIIQNSRRICVIRLIQFPENQLVLSESPSFIAENILYPAQLLRNIAISAEGLTHILITIDHELINEFSKIKVYSHRYWND